MKADDPRHGTDAQIWSAVAGCLCDQCEKVRARRRRDYKTKRRAMTDARKVTRHVNHLLANGWTQVELVGASGLSAATVSDIRHGVYATVRNETALALLEITGTADTFWRVSTVGTIRRMQALATLGWTLRETCRDAGLSQRFYSELIDKQRGSLSRKSAEVVAALYDKRSMVRPPETPHRKRTVGLARTNGWAPPLAWDDDAIDDPNATPHVGTRKRNPHHEQTDERHATLTDLDAWGYGISEACRRLNVSRIALEAWAYRHDAAAVYQRLVERENYAEKVNGSTAERRAG